MSNSLIEALARADCPPAEIHTKEGGVILALPQGGRVIGLFVSGCDDNLFWTNPGLLTEKLAREIFARQTWTNTGGDRIWIGPETEAMIRDLEDPFATYTVPPGIDPGNFRIHQNEDTIAIDGTGRMPLQRSGGCCDVTLHKVIRPADYPFRPDQKMGNDVSYAGYTQTTTLEIQSGGDGACPYLDIWSALVLPAPGWMIVPTLRRTTPRDYLAPSGPDRIWVHDNCVVFRIDGQEQHKIAVRAEHLTGRAGYFRKAKGYWTVVVREFRVDKGGLYVDTPWNNLREYGYCFQSYNDSGESGEFGELEYHSTAVGGDTGLSTLTDVSHVWAYCGPENMIRKIGESLLGVSMP